MSPLFLLSLAQLVIALLLIGAILLQAQGTGLGVTFGGEGNVFRTKRGVEKRLFQTTIVLAILFFGCTLMRLLWVA